MTHLLFCGESSAKILYGLFFNRVSIKKNISVTCHVVSMIIYLGVATFVGAFLATGETRDFVDDEDTCRKTGLAI